MPGPDRSISFDRVADRYDETRGGVARGRSAADALSGWLTPHGPIVEVGVGTGLVAAALQGSRHDVVGVDIAGEMLKRAKQRLGARVVLGDALQLPVRGAAAGSVYAVHVLHLVADMAALMREVGRVLRPGGRFLVICTADDQDLTDAEVIVTGLRQRVVGDRPDLPRHVVPVAQASGLRTIHTEQLSQPDEISPDEYVATLQERVWGWTWDIDRTVWAAEVEPTIEALRGLPEPHRPRLSRGLRTLLVFERG